MTVCSTSGSPCKVMQVWKYRPLLLCKHLIFRHVLPEAMMCNLLKLLTRTVLQGLPKINISRPLPSRYS